MRSVARLDNVAGASVTGDGIVIGLGAESPLKPSDERPHRRVRNPPVKARRGPKRHAFAAVPAGARLLRLTLVLANNFARVALLAVVARISGPTLLRSEGSWKLVRAQAS